MNLYSLISGWSNNTSKVEPVPMKFWDDNGEAPAHAALSTVFDPLYPPSLPPHSPSSHPRPWWSFPPAVYPSSRSSTLPPELL